jgi:hypothetical protein
VHCSRWGKVLEILTMPPSDRQTTPQDMLIIRAVHDHSPPTQVGNKLLATLSVAWGWSEVRFGHVPPNVSSWTQDTGKPSRQFETSSLIRVCFFVWIGGCGLITAPQILFWDTKLCLVFVSIHVPELPSKPATMTKFTKRRDPSSRLGRVLPAC